VRRKGVACRARFALADAVGEASGANLALHLERAAVIV